VVESSKSYDELMAFLRTLTERDSIILHIVNSNSDDHPTVATPIILFLKEGNQVHTLSFGHQDSICQVPKKQVFDDIDELACIKWTIDRKALRQTTGIRSNVIDANLALFTETNKLIDLFEFETSAHTFIKRTCKNRDITNQVIPLMKHLEYFEELCEAIERAVYKHIDIVNDPSFKLLNFNALDNLSDIESNGLKVDRNLFDTHFSCRVYGSDMVYSQYNLFTATGRPSSRFGGVNYAALNKDDGSRQCFVSRFGNNGKLMLVDYSAFHPHLICQIVNYDLPKGTDIYHYLATLYFNRKTVSDLDVEEAKKITFKQLYGGVEDQYQHIKYFVHLKDYIGKKWSEFEKKGYVLTPWFQRKIDDKHLKNANPNKLFNYILQASELEYISPIMTKLNDVMTSKKSKPILYTYDSLLFDISCDEVAEIVPFILETMSGDGRIPLKAYVGSNYHEMEQVSLESPSVC
jgi:hypothetical protein